MPVHDWTRVGPGPFHHFHMNWITALAGWLNTGGLPPEFVGLIERDIPESKFDIERIAERDVADVGSVDRDDQYRYSRLANHLAIRYENGKLVAIIEIVSPGMKNGKRAYETFLDNSLAFLSDGIHLVVIDLFPPGKRDPYGFHDRIWSEMHDDLEVVPFQFPRGNDLTTVSYFVGREVTAYVEPFAVGDRLPDMPLFLATDRYLSLPLEATYDRAWQDLPRPYRLRLDSL